MIFPREQWDDGPPVRSRMTNLEKERLEDLQKALGRLIRFSRALIHMGAVETPAALEAELTAAGDALDRSRHD